MKLFASLVPICILLPAMVSGSPPFPGRDVDECVNVFSLTTDMCNCLLNDGKSMDYCGCVASGEHEAICACLDDGNSRLSCAACLGSLASSGFHLNTKEPWDRWMNDATQLILPQTGPYYVSLLQPPFLPLHA